MSFTEKTKIWLCQTDFKLQVIKACNNKSMALHTISFIGAVLDVDRYL